MNERFGHGPSVLDATTAKEWIQATMGGEQDFRIVEMTADLARWLMGKNVDNYRRQRQRRIDTYQRAILEDGWFLAGESVNLDLQGRLQNGQHRLPAIEVALADGGAVQMLVCVNYPEKAKAVTDTGIPRSLVDLFRRAGEVNAQSLAASIRFCLLWERGELPYGGFVPSHQELLAWLERNPGLRQSVRLSAPVTKKPLQWPGSSAAAVHYRFSMEHPDQCERYFAELVKGEELKSGNPILAHRRWLERTGARSQVEYAAIAVLAINAYLTGRRKILMSWTPSAGFPVLVTRRMVLMGTAPAEGEEASEAVAT